MATDSELQAEYAKLPPELQRKIRLQLLQKKAGRNLASFGEYVFKHKPAPHHQKILDLLEKNPRDNLLIVAPPRHAKTTWVGVIYPTYRIAKDPGVHVLYTSSTVEQALKQSVAIRNTIQTNKQFKEIVPDVWPDMSTFWQKHMWQVKSPRFETDKDPTLIASGFDGNILGSTADEIIIDDLNDRKNTATPYMRQKVQDWVSRTLMTRLSPTGRVVCIMTRWHADDLAAYFQDIGFKILVMPAIGCGGCSLDHEHRGKDKALWPSEWPFERLLQMKKGMDIWQWEGVYQGNPTPSGGSIWLEEWWRYYASEVDNSSVLSGLPPSFSLKVQSWDCSQKDGEQNDYSVCETWGYEKGNFYLLDVFRRKMQYHELKQQAIEQYIKHEPGVVLVEDASSGSSLVQELSVQTSIPIVAIKVEGDKQARARAATPAAQAGRVFIPDRADWLYEFVKEHSDFPTGRYRDQCDATSQAITWIRLNTSSTADYSDVFEELKSGKSNWAPTSYDALGVGLDNDGFLSRWGKFDGSVGNSYDGDLGR